MRLLADDLTGALDSAARFTARFGPIEVHFGPAVPKIRGHAALDLACRDGSPQAAAIAAREAVAFLHDRNDGLAFKKIDSLLRGHWAVEIAALLETGHYRHCILAPAFPEQGRVTCNGRQCLVGSDGKLQPVPIDLRQALAAQGLITTADAAETAAFSNARKVAIEICDAENAHDLSEIARRGRDLPGPVLWCGTAGLAGALAGERAPIIDKVSLPALALIGSNHQVMQEQIAAARGIETCAVLTLGDDPVENMRAIEAALVRSPRCVAYFAVAHGTSSIAAARLIEQRLNALVPHLMKPGTLVAAGGETLRAICRASAADHLLVLGENRPGIPCSRIVGGQWDGVQVISKSGAFGTASFFAELFS